MREELCWVMRYCDIYMSRSALFVVCVCVCVCYICFVVVSFGCRWVAWYLAHQVPG